VKLLDTALYIARLEDPSGSLRRERVEIEPLLRRCLDVLEPLAGERRIALIPTISPEPITALGDEQRLQQVLLNVLTNALKFGPPASTVTVRTAVHDRTVSVEVHDNGPGIDKAQRERIFEPFERLDAGRRGVAGTGLGLCVSRALMEAMGGSLGVVDSDESESEASGATFRIALRTAPERLRLEAVPGPPHGDDPVLSSP